MKVVIQRVTRARVTVESEVTGEIDRGLLLLIGFTANDSESNLQWMARKIAGLRIFEDEQGLMNLSVNDFGGQVLAVSQFTLYANVRKGKRPSFVEAARPDQAERLYDSFCQMLAEEGLKVETGTFGARMEVELVNSGPVTVIVEK